VGTVLTRAEIFAIDDRKIEWCPVPEWSSEDNERGVFIQGLSGTDRDSFDMAMIEQRQIGKGKITQELNFRNLRAKLVVRTAVDSADPNEAKPIFTEADVEALGRKNGAALQRMYAVAQRLSGLSSEDVEELTKDLGNGQSDASGSDLPSPSDTQASPLLSDGSAAENSPSGEPSTPSSPSENEG
jgi:hypothetical protein